MNDLVYHYTNLNAFKSIIENRELWLTRIDCLNDINEYKYYKGILNRARTEFIQENNITAEYDLMLLSVFTDRILVNLRDEYYKKTFVLSLSVNGDSIPMWNYYSDMNGIAIGFSRDALTSEFNRKIEKYYTLSAGKIEYSIEKQIDMTKKKFLQIIETANKPELIFNPDVYEVVREAEKTMSLMWDESHLFKSDEFAYEQEYRITLCKLGVKEENKEMDRNYWLVSGSNIKPIRKFKAVDTWKDTIKRIVISPYNRSESIINNIKEFLNDNGVNLEDENICTSCCPIREI